MSTNEYKEAFTGFRAQIDALDPSALDAVDLGKVPPAPAALAIVQQRWVNEVSRLKAVIETDARDVGMALANVP